MATIEDALYAILTAESDVTALVGTAPTARIFPGFINQGAAYPQVCWQVIASPRWRTLAGRCNPARARIQITCWDQDTAAASGHDGVVELANLVRDTLDEYSGTIAGITIQAVHCADEGGDIPNPSAGNAGQTCYGRRQDYTFYYNEP